jgi:hypothetical protein
MTRVIRERLVVLPVLLLTADKDQPFMVSKSMETLER